MDDSSARENAGATPRRTVDLLSRKIPHNILKLIPYEMMRRHQMLPFDLRDGKLLVAMADPDDIASMNQVRILTGYEPEVFSASSTEIIESLTRSFEGLGIDITSDAFGLSFLISNSKKSGIPEAGSIVDKLIDIAIDGKASDIHIEPQSRSFFARLRVDGVLNTVHSFPKSLQASVSSRIKVMAGLDIAEKRLPQDGQFHQTHRDREIDFRVSTLPGKYGEKIVIRILDKSSLNFGLDRLGFDPETQGIFESLVEKPHGLILVTGPTGSGKTSTLYATLNRLRSPLKNIITLEDPVEYEILSGGAGNEIGITQVQVNPKIGFTFASGLRAALRQDPDVIMVGEIRDKETAETAMKASLTGHLVLSSLHTNDAPSALTRLRDMGIEPYLIASTVIGVLAQRLLRLLCNSCKEPYKLPERLARELSSNRRDSSQTVFYRAKGCRDCHGTGYSGRSGIFELLSMTEPLKHAIYSGASLAEIYQFLQSKGFKNLRAIGLKSVGSGLTSVEEVFRVTSE